MANQDLIHTNTPWIGQPNLEVFAATLQALASVDPDLYVLTSDSRGSGKLGPFSQRFPQQIIETGIAEQNLVGVAAGLASMGKQAFAVSPACFLTARALEQIKNDVCYSDHAVKLIGISAGVSYGALGTTHHSLHDFAALRAIHNLTVVAPADNYETEQAIRQAYRHSSPVYLRFGKKPMPRNLSEPEINGSMTSESPFQLGFGRVVRVGVDLTFVATGEAVWPCVQAADQLAATGLLKCAVISMHTIKPLDVHLLRNFASRGKPIITVEEHSVHGGLGEAVGSWLMQNGFQNPFRIVGLPDEPTVTGSQTEIFDHYGLSTIGLTAMATSLTIKQKNHHVI